jgi:hypothetical protein
MLKTFTAAAVAALALAAAGGASAADGSVRPPAYRLPDGSPAAKLVSHGGAINPGVLVGLNFARGADSPGWGVNLDSALLPAVRTALSDGDVRFVFSLTGFADAHGHLDVPGGEGMAGGGGGTGFTRTYGDHVVQVLLNFAAGDYTGWTDAAFAPGFKPPGDAVGQDFHFQAYDVGGGGGAGLEGFALNQGAAPDARGGPLDIAFAVFVDGQQLSFTAAPEPASWTLMIAGFGAAGALLRRRAALA